MRTILGIDAAWTLAQPSGVALVAEVAPGRWRLAALAASYRGFLADREEHRPSGATPDPAALVAAAAGRIGVPPVLVAIDMPLAHSPIVTRRAADNAVSSAYGGRKCGTHSPSAIRPGPISDDLRAGFDAAGYPLRTAVPLTPGLIEVYPHPALVELAGAAERLPYKAGKLLTYWPGLPLADRKLRLAAQWQAIVALLDTRIEGVAAALPTIDADASGVARKAHEDRIDAIVCAWVGIEALAGRAVAYGDADAAIWIPTAAWR
jgi:predicted RNase H-like nuclease